MELSALKLMIKEQFSCQSGIVAVLLYGSYAKGLARPDSDVDIAVLYEYDSVPGELELWDLKSKLELAIHLDIDLVCLNNADPIIANQIYQFHLPVLVNKPANLSNYFSLLSSEYAELKEFIRPMEDQILQRRYRA